MSINTHTRIKYGVYVYCVQCTRYTGMWYVMLRCIVGQWEKKIHTDRCEKKYSSIHPFLRLTLLIFQSALSQLRTISFLCTFFIFCYFVFLLFCFCCDVFFFFNFWKLDWQGLEYYYCVYIFVVHAPIQYVDALHMDNGHMNVVVWAAHIWILTSIPFLQHFC